MASKKVLTLANLAEPIKAAQYAVRGQIVIKAESIDNALKEGKKLPFKKLTSLNIGNPQALGQPPISFNREVIACLLDTSLLQKPVYHPDVVKRAKEYLKCIPSIGVYTESQGMRFIRQNIADFIERRDNGVKCDKNNIFLTNGAGDSVRPIIQMLLNDKNDGIMIPVPRYPLYSAEIVLREGRIVGYYLDETKNWNLSMESLKKSYDSAVQEGIKVKGLVVINPGNPTGSILDEQNIAEILQFCHERSIVVMADEVYQKNVYDDSKKFHSFKKVLMNMGAPICNTQELVSFHSISKGIQGECGLRGGYMELINIDPAVMKELYKLQSITLCSNTIGQVAMDLMVNPPSKRDGCAEETIKKYQDETSHLFNSLKKRAKIVTDYLRDCKNITTNEIQGAMYAFPQVQLSEKALEAAKKAGMVGDVFYCNCCLDETGIVIVPGSGFGQVDGTHHFRITILVYDAVELEETMKAFKKFNEDFHKKYE